MNAAKIFVTTVVATTWLIAASGCASPESGDTPAPPAAESPSAPSAPEAPEAPPEAAAETPQAHAKPECHAEPAQFAVGQAYTPELAEKVREASGSTVVRALRPGQVVTMEFRFDRVSLHLDDKDIVTRVSCG
jgi:hypothetical protein